jgi:hypothetical protein
MRERVRGYMAKKGCHGGAHFGRTGCEPEMARRRWGWEMRRVDWLSWIRWVRAATTFRSSKHTRRRWLHYPSPLAAPLPDAFTLHIDLQPTLVLFSFPAVAISYCPSVSLGPLGALMKLMSLGMRLWVSVVDVPFGG